MKSTCGSRKRVAYLVHDFGTGGIERCIVNLVNNLAAEQFQAMVVCLTKSGASELAIKPGIQVFEIEKRPGWDSKAIKALADLFEREQVEVLHTHNWGTLVEGSLARRSAQVPVHVHTEHGQGLHDGLPWWKKYLRKHISYWAFTRLTQLCVCAHCVAPLIEARSGFPKAKIRYLPNGVPEPRVERKRQARRENREALGIQAGAVVLGSTGRLVSVKGFELAIRALAELKDSSTPVHLLLVGDGESRKDLEGLAHSLGLKSHVHLVGRQTQVGPWLETFDIFLNTSRSEAMSLSVLEAMAMGLPIIACDVGDNREILLGSELCGLIIENREPATLADEVRKLMGDPEFATALGQRAKRRYEARFSIQSMVDQHAALYDRCP